MNLLYAFDRYSIYEKNGSIYLWDGMEYLKTDIEEIKKAVAETTVK